MCFLLFIFVWKGNCISRIMYIDCFGWSTNVILVAYDIIKSP
jgi:hypothetical protein